MAAGQVAQGTGQVVVWGGSLISAEPPVLGAKSVAASMYCAMLLRDGTVRAWGVGSLEQGLVGAGSITAIAAAKEDLIGLRADGTVLSAGNRKLGDVPAGLSRVTAIAASGHHALALQDGRVIAWGFPTTAVSVPTDLTSVVAIAAGAGHNAAVTSDGAVRCWGDDQYGQCQVPPQLGPVSRLVACGGFLDGSTVLASHTLVVTSAGVVVGWGADDQTQCRPPSSLANPTAIAAGDEHSVALSASGSVVCWGKNDAGQCSVPANLGEATGVAAGNRVSIAVRADGTVRAWGSNVDHQQDFQRSSRDLVEVASAGGAIHALGLDALGGIVGFGWNKYGQSDPPKGLSEPVTKVAAGAAHSAAVGASGRLHCWGYNGYGQCNTPAFSGEVSGVACGAADTAVLLTDGRVLGWGKNGVKNLTGGSGTVAAGGFLQAGASDIAYSSHVLWIDSSGQVQGWGSQVAGAFGSDAARPAWVPPVLTGVVAIAAGGWHSLAMTSNAQVVAWGSNRSGQCDVPAGLSGVERIAAGREHSLVLLGDGSVRCWGSDRNEVGAPVGCVSGKPSNLAGVTRIGGGRDFSLALVEVPAACSASGRSGVATIRQSGSAWRDVQAWVWDDGSVQVPGGGSIVDFGSFGSIASDCSANASTLTARSGTSLLIPASASTPGNDFSIRVGGTASLAGRLWLLGVSGGGSTLPLDLNIPVLSAGVLSGNFDLIQTDVRPPAGKFLTLVPETVSGRTVLSLRLLDLPNGGSLAGANAGTYSGTAVAAATIDLNEDGFDDLALAVDFGASQPGLIQVLMNDGAGNLGGVSVLENTPAGPTCIAAGDVDGDGHPDLAVGFSSDGTTRVYRRNPSNAMDLLPGMVLSGYSGTPRSVAVVPAPSGSVAAMKKSRVKPRFMPSGNNVAVGTSAAKLYFYSNAGVQTQAFLNLSGSVEVMASGRNVDGVGSGGIATGGIRSNTVDGLVASETGYVSTITDRGSGYAIRQTMNITAKPRGIDVADIDDDGLDDIVTANAEPQTPDTGSGLPVLSIFRNRPTGFTGGVPYQPAGASSGLDVTLIDVDGDGDRDIVSVYKRVGTDSEAALLRVDTLGAGTPISIGQTTVLDASDPILSKRGNLDGVGGEDVFLVVQPASNSAASFMPTNPFVKPYLSQQDARRGDLDGSGTVDAADIGELLIRFGTSDPAADLDGSGVVDAADIGALLLLFG